MQQHYGEVKRLITFGKKSDVHAKHFATQVPDATPSPCAQCEGITCCIIWQGNPTTAV